jgi:hypothetical protein
MIPLIIFRYILQVECVELTTHHVANIICMLNSSWIVADFDEFLLVFCDFQMEIVFFPLHDGYHITC